MSVSWVELRRFATNKRFQKVLLALLPVLALLGFAIGQPLILLASMVVIPAVLLAAPSEKTMAPGGGIVSKNALLGRLNDGLAYPGRTSRTGCIVFEIDDFAALKKQLGPTGADEIASLALDRIAALLRKDDVLTVLSESQFALALADIRIPELGAILSLIERIQQAALEPMPLDRTTVHITLSAGFCLDSQTPDRTGEALLDASLLALGDALKYAPSGLRGYSKGTNGKAVQGSEALDEILGALRDGSIRPWFQPQICTDTGEITGFESLARWVHPTRGTIPPMEFLPILEEAGKMEDLSETILQHALTAIRQWDRAGLNVPTVGVNFATQELRNPGLVERIKWDVDRFELDPSRLTVEILETVISETDDDVITRNIRALGNQGFKIDLDDFGTGHASITNIRRFQVDRIKIDRSFVTHVDDDPEQRRMIAAIVGMAEQLEIETLAEGVETVGERSILSQLGCNALQGFGIARPMPFEETIDWLKEHKRSLGHPTMITRKTG